MGMPQKTKLNLFLDILSSNIPAVSEFEAYTFAIATLRAFIVNKPEKLHEWELMSIVYFSTSYKNFCFLFDNIRYWLLFIDRHLLRHKL